MQLQRVLDKRESEWREIRRQTILAWLNDPLRKGLCSKLGQQRIEELVASLIYLNREFRKRSHKRGSTEELNRRATKVNEILSLYPSCKRVWWDHDEGLEFGNDFGELWAEHLEDNAAYYAVELAEIDALDGVLRCECGKWFFARRRHQRSCSPNCRHKLYEQKPTVKAMRRKYMRDYYRTYMKDYRKRKAANVK